MSDDYGTHTISKIRRIRLLSDQVKLLREVIAWLKVRKVEFASFELSKIRDADLIEAELKKFPKDPDE